MKVTALVTTSLISMALTSVAQESPKRLGNPVVAFAKTTEESIAAQEKELSDELAAMVAVIDAAVGQVKGQDWQSEKTAVESFRPLVGKLSLAAKELVAKEAAYAAGVDELAEVLKSAPDAYRQAAEVFRGYAAAEAFPDIREDYLQLANAWERLAKTMSDRQKDLSPEKAEVQQFLNYVRSTSKFLERFDEHLAAYPRVETLAARDDYLKKMKVYVEYFGKLRELLQKLNGRLGTPPEASQPTTPKVASTRPTTITLASHSRSTPLPTLHVSESLIQEEARRPLLEEFERTSRSSSAQSTVSSESSSSIGLIQIGTETWGLVKDDGQLSLHYGQVRGVYRHGRWIGEVEVRNSFVDSHALRPLGGIRLQSGDRIALKGG